MPFSSIDDDPSIPTLTRRAAAFPVPTTPTTHSPPSQATAPVTATTSPLKPERLSSAVLQTLLQTEMEQALERALDDAMDNVRLRLEQEIPAIVERTLRRVRAEGRAG